MLSPKENALIAYRHGLPEYVPCFFSDVAMSMAAPFIEKPVKADSDNTGFDAWGVNWTFEKQSRTWIPTPGRYLFEEMADWTTAVTFPELDSIDWVMQAETDMVSTMMGMTPGMTPDEYRTNKLKVCNIQQGMFERLHACMGMENALMALIAEPDECFDFFSAVADYKIKYLKIIAQYYDFDLVRMHDDYGSQDRLFMSPEVWRKLIKPNLKRIVNAAHDLGFLYQHHSCGHVEELVDDFIELGMDAVDTWQFASNPNVGELKRTRMDKLTFCGGFDNTYVLDRIDVSPDEIRKEYRRTIDLMAPGGSYVAFPVTGTFSFKDVFMDEHLRYGMNFYNHMHKQA